MNTLQTRTAMESETLIWIPWQLNKKKKEEENLGVTHKISYITTIETLYLWLTQ